MGYRRSSRGGSFKTRNYGDAGIAELRRKTQTTVQGLESQKAQHRQITAQNLSGMQDAFKTTEQMIQKRDAREDQHYRRKRDAIKQRRDDEVQSLQRAAHNAKQKSETWKYLSSTLGKVAFDIGNVAAQRANAIRTAEQSKLDTPWYEEASEYTTELLQTDLEAHQKQFLTYAEYSKAAGLIDLNQAAFFTVNAQSNHAYNLKEDIDGIVQNRINFLQKNIKDINLDTDWNQVDQMYDDLLGQIEDANGWENTTAKGVIEFRRKFRQKQQTAVRQAKINFEVKKSNDLVNATFDTFVNSPTNDNLNNLYFVFKNSVNSDGDFVGAAGGREALFTRLATATRPVKGSAFKREFVFNDADIQHFLRYQTPEEGKIKGKENWGSRFTDLSSLIIEKRHNIRKQLNTEQTTLTKSQDFEKRAEVKRQLENTGEFAPGGDREGEAWNGSKDTRIQLEKYYRGLGLTKTADLISSYSPFDETNYRKELQLEYVQKLYDAGDWNTALEFIENAPGLTSEARRDAKAKFNVLNQLALAGTDIEKVDELLEGRLLALLGEEYIDKKMQMGDINQLIPSLEPTVVKARIMFVNKFQELSVNATDAESLQNALRGAEDYTLKQIETRSGVFQVEAASDAIGSSANFPQQQPGLIDPNSNFVVNYTELLGQGDVWGEQEVISSNALSRIARNLKNGEPIVIPPEIKQYSIARGIPVSELINAQLSQTRVDDITGQEMTWKQRMRPGAKDIALGGIDTPGYLNVAQRISKARGLDEIQRLSIFVQKGGTQNLDQVSPVVKNNIKAVEYIPLVETLATDSETRYKWATLFAECGDTCNLSDILIDEANPAHFTLKAGSITSRTMLNKVGKGGYSGITYIPGDKPYYKITKEF